jgi:ABC-2 type transport system permease protein
MNLWRLEWLRLFRTKRWIALVGIYVFFGLLGPLSARYLSEIVERFGGEVQVTFPPPVPADGMIQYVSNVSQVGLLVAVVIAAGSLAFDAKPEMGVFLRTRVPRVWDILVPRLSISFLAVGASFVLGALVAWYETAVLIGSLPVGGTLVGIGYGLLYLALAVTVVAAAGSRANSVLGAVLITIVVLLVMPIVGIVEAVGEWLPSHLVGALSGIVGGAGMGEYVPAAAVTVALLGLCLWLAIRWSASREL